ncbi:MAG: D-alanyl-D-alanine carboxypeptidase family protein, partial [Blautia sp.]
MKRIKKWVCLFLLIIGNFMGNCLWIRAEEGQGPGSLYASSAVLMDGDSGRILYEKNGYEPRPMASTTKIMTCILALEEGNEEDVVTASFRAASSPKVRLGVTEGETFRFGDLLYSLMLESHNDAAVMIAEHLDGSVEKFAERMNEKAREIGCKNTYFITPNGLDASVKIKGKEKVHSTTAADLSRIMRYCIMESPERENFLNITRTDSYSFYDGERKQNFACYNHNAFLGMMEGALTGKTGFTANAGYCYVGALQRDGKTLIVALLACGWPN